jgi:hypothetical protein
LNWLYTPSKTAGFMIGGETFRRLPRGVDMKQGTNQLIVGPMATSFEQNLCMLATPDTVMYSRTVSDWKPLQFPESPKRIVGTGSSPYVDYGGTGIYTIETAGKDELKLTVNPDSRLIGNCMTGSFATSVAVLENNRQWFRLKLSGWDNARCLQNDKPLTKIDGGWVLLPGEYSIRR